MKNDLLFKILLAALAVVIILGVSITSCQNRQVDKLNKRISQSEGRNMVYAMNEAALVNEKKVLKLENVKIKAKTDSLEMAYQLKLRGKDITINEYRKSQANQAKLSDSQSMKLFLDNVHSDAQPLVVATSPDTCFSVRAGDIRYANSKFLHEDELWDLKMQCEGRESLLIQVVESKNKELANKDSQIQTMDEHLTNKGNENQELKSQLDDQKKINKKEKTKNTVQKIGIGLIGVTAFFVALSL